MAVKPVPDCLKHTYDTLMGRTNIPKKEEVPKDEVKDDNKETEQK